MRVIKGIGVSRGHAIGCLFRYCRKEIVVEKRDISNVRIEFERFVKARNWISAQYTAMMEKYDRTHTAELFGAYRAMLTDANISERIWSYVSEKKCNVEYAVSRVFGKLISEFEAFDDDYMKARAHDMQEIKERLLITLSESKDHNMFGGLLCEREEGIVAADSLTAMEIAQLDCSKIRGIILTGGSQFSHTTILARNRDIPMIIGADASIYEECSKEILMDGGSGEIMLEFSEEEASQHISEAEKKSNNEITDIGSMKLYYSIGSAKDVQKVLEKKGQGIGLYRTEWQYLKSKTMPSEEDLYDEYNAVVSQMCGKPVIIRTMDLGDDKMTAYLAEQLNEEGVLGTRGVRLSLQNKEVFLDQLRAIYRASAEGNASVMFPMITSLQEFRECKKMCRRAIEELQFQGQPLDRYMEVGAMIETPAAVLIAKELAKEADFFSIGTNDLSQSILACERQDIEMQKCLDDDQPALMHAIQMIAEAAHEAGIPVSVCGELTTSQKWREFFRKTGIDAISVDL